MVRKTKKRKSNESQKYLRAEKELAREYLAKIEEVDRIARQKKAKLFQEWFKKKVALKKKYGIK